MESGKIARKTQDPGRSKASHPYYYVTLRSEIFVRSPITDHWTYFYILYRHQRHQAQYRPGNKRYPVIHDPQHPANDREHDSRNVIDGKTHCHARGDVVLIGNLLKIGFDRHGEAK